MKHIQLVIVILLLFIANYSYAQNNGMTQTYPGTWQYDYGNERFIVKIWQQGNNYYGHYKRVQLNNGNIGNTIFNSRMVNSLGVAYPYSAIYAGFTNEHGLTGFIDDNEAAGNTYNPRSGNLQIKMLQFPTACQTCTVKATWKVTSTGGMTVGTPPPFSVPLDITLTKVSNTITLD